MDEILEEELEKKESEEFEERIVEIRRTAKVTKGGKTLSFRVLAVVGNRKGKVGVGVGKAREVPEAIRKAIAAARASVVEIPLYKTTIPHEVFGRQDASKVLLRPAAPGTGIIAGSTVRAVVELAGVQNVLTKCLGSTASVNLALATLNGLKDLVSPEKAAKLRDITPAQVLYGARKEA
ncbi:MULTISPECIES: 30S ribosomal protein S5 [Pseudothermotoga]|jgi:small subunit ribosomal protein S5|uniref:Small ribosomal subunit protein uS5 n=1 Tax=Pseudothermotoga lettingae (strain ATCC BAA-301 / DSM 14385 / NBRC 107922 / TMO) TaxID=416591 RepID=RS5_PSELT|nr:MULTISPECIES: 30S ribosomal protein S5 [Pseudothermotoga]A8F4S8.1 RecName: Full=Small ribosomal subunit protein uS5; AltName: Full=30S ribosomal protein S5 [Pseudothermotoga lettingae TMO]ABV33162.1 ribosomal protein S5 [Pseudothermotoga lettingae TMO]KUK21653.1 MAG: 30S ribosomal protein S5 [Pseudothermotoga lettingae]MDI3494429.1 small subunit ribosomal protein [Pseudothermotoga sp.]MDK2884168.1 small subunit ribosomal protein [Pseudothermotoga sp.]GLI47836.1 30S ribosomal protein S5 [Ps